MYLGNTYHITENCQKKFPTTYGIKTQFTYNATNLSGWFSQNLSKLYVGFLRFIPTNSYQKNFWFESPIPKNQDPKKGTHLEIFRQIVQEVQIIRLVIYCRICVSEFTMSNFPTPY